MAFLCPRKVKNILLPKTYQLGLTQENELDQSIDSNRTVRGDQAERNDRSLMDLMQELDCNVALPARMRKHSEEGVKFFEKTTTEMYKKRDNIVIEKEVTVETKLIKDNLQNKNTSIWKKNTAATENKSQDGMIKGGKIRVFKEEDDSIFLDMNKKLDLDDSVIGKKPMSVFNGNSQQVAYRSPKKRSKVILSSEWMKAMRKAPGRVDPKWDNYELYKNKKLKKESSTPPSSIENKLQILKMILDLKNGNFIKEVDNKALVSVGSVSLTVVVLQLIFSRKYEIFFFNSI